MNKLERRQKEKQLWQKRVNRLNWWTLTPLIYRTNMFCYKKQTRPCSCSLCKNERYNRKAKHKNREVEQYL